MIPVVVGSNPIAHPTQGELAGADIASDVKGKFLFYSFGPLAQLVEQLTLNQ